MVSDSMRQFISFERTRFGGQRSLPVSAGDASIELVAAMIACMTLMLAIIAIA